MSSSSSSSSSSSHPLAEIESIQFGLLTARQMEQISVYRRLESASQHRDLIDARLGLPNLINKCLSCGSRDIVCCEGHFGHVNLPYPIYHPSCINHLVKVLENICLKCYCLKKKKTKKEGKIKLNIKTEEGAGSSQDKGGLKSGGGGTDILALEKENCTGLPMVMENEMIKKEPMDEHPLILLEDNFGTPMNTSDASSSLAIVPICSQISLQPSSCKTISTVTAFIDLTEEDQEDDSKTPITREAEDSSAAFRETKENVFRNSSHKDEPSKNTARSNDGNMFRKIDSEEKTGFDKESCNYCQKGSLQKIMPKVSQKRLINGEIVELVKLIAKEKSSEIPPGYWSFLGGGDSQSHIDSSEHALLPSEALNILRNIPLDVFNKLGIDVSTSHPEAFILQKILIPPNCARIPEQPFSANHHIGADPWTQMLGKIVRNVESYKHHRAMKTSTKTTAIREAEELQSMMSLYLRMKGAPKVKGSKEPASKLRGRAPNSNVKLHTQKRLHDNIIGKVTNFSSRGVLAGDPFLALNEIGIPEEVARGITVPEFVTKMNVEALQCQLEEESSKGLRTFVRIINREGEKKELDCEKGERALQVGDCVSRQLRDGDLAFCNRPPSLNKHSIIGLKVRIFHRESFSINPLLCNPLGADFDGDCLHLFFPQSYPSLVELRELLMFQNQMLESHDGGDPIIKLSQDILLAANLLMAANIFVNKETAQQLGMWCASVLPRPAIIHSPKGPLWTGLQFSELLFCLDSDSEVHGEDFAGLLKYTLQQRGPDSAILFVKSAQSLLTEWLSITGFSAGIWDFLGANNIAAIRELKSFKEKHFERLKECVLVQLHNLVFVASKYILNVKDAKKGFVPDDIYASFDVSMAMFPSMVEEIIRTSLMTIEKEQMTRLDHKGALSKMVQSGSKGSITQLIQHCSFLGLQYSKGNKLSPSEQSSRGDIFWVERGLIESSYIHGLNPREFYMHCLSSREGSIQSGLVLHEPGCLSKNLLHFLRDIYISYDGTVRTKLSRDIIQFKYGGTKMEDYSFDRNIEKLNQHENSELRWEDTVHAGEPVGALSAMAVAKPAYEMILNTFQKNKMRGPCPLNTLKETIYSRKKSKLKVLDRMVILRLNKCEESDRFWQERTASLLQRKLQKVSFMEFASHVWISYSGRSSEEGCQIEDSRMKSGLIGHIKICEEAMARYGISSETILTNLKNSLLSNNQLPKDLYGQLLFGASDHCELPIRSSDLSGTGFCIHVFWRSALNQFGPSLLDPVRIMKDTILPSLLDTNILGNKQIQSATIVWEDSDIVSRIDDGRLSLTVIVEKESVKKRGDAWNVVQKACQTLFQYVDWRNSGPYSIQEVQCGLGVEAARSSIIKRLKSVLTSVDKKLHADHVSLVSDVMTHAGYVVGLNVAGFQEYTSALSLSCPLKKGLFQNPVKCYLDASIKGRSEDLDSIVSATTLGKVASIGTGFEFECLWRQPQVSEDPVFNLGMGAGDIFDFLSYVGMSPTPDSPVKMETFSSVEAQYDMREMETDNPLIVSDKLCQEDDDMNKSKICSQRDDGWGTPTNENSRKDDVTDICDGWPKHDDMNKSKICSQSDDGWGTPTNENSRKDEVTDICDGWPKHDDMNKSKICSQSDAGWGIPTNENSRKDEVTDICDGWPKHGDINKSNICSQSDDGWGIPTNENSRKDEETDICDGWPKQPIENNELTSGTTTLGYAQVDQKGMNNETKNRQNQRSGWGLPTSSDGDNVPNHAHGWGEAFEQKGEAGNQNDDGWGLPSEKGFEKCGLGDTHIDNLVHVNEAKDGWGQSFDKTHLEKEKRENMRDISKKSGRFEKTRSKQFVPTGANVIPIGPRKFNNRNLNTVQEGISNKMDIPDNTTNLNTLCQSDTLSGDSDSMTYPVLVKSLEKQGKEDESGKILDLPPEKDSGKGEQGDVHIDTRVEVSEDKDGWGQSSETTNLTQETPGWGFIDNKKNIQQSLETTISITEDQTSGWDVPTTQDSYNAPNDGWGEVSEKEGEADGWKKTGWGVPYERGFKKNGPGDMQIDNPVSDREHKDSWVSGYERTNSGQEKSGWDCNETENKTEKNWETSGQYGHSERCANKFIPTGANVIPISPRKFSHRNPNSMREVKPHNPSFLHASEKLDISSLSDEQKESMRIKCEFDELSELMRTILHGRSYQIGDRLNPEDEKNVMEKILLFHPSKDDKIGCGVDYLKIDSHKDHPSRCFFVVRKDGTEIDFSYWKCLKGFLTSKYPQHVDQFSSYFSRPKKHELDQ